MPDDLSVTPAEALEQAQELLDADRPFHAHEVLEAAWKDAPEDERELWRGLAQIAVGVTHVRRGNSRGAQALLERAANRIETYAEVAPHSINVTGVAAEARRVAEAAGGGPVDMPIRFQLTHRPETD